MSILVRPSCPVVCARTMPAAKPTLHSSKQLTIYSKKQIKVQNYKRQLIRRGQSQLLPYSHFIKDFGRTFRQCHKSLHVWLHCSGKTRLHIIFLLRLLILIISYTTSYAAFQVDTTQLVVFLKEAFALNVAYLLKMYISVVIINNLPVELLGLWYKSLWAVWEVVLIAGVN